MCIFWGPSGFENTGDGDLASPDPDVGEVRRASLLPESQICNAAPVQKCGTPPPNNRASRNSK